MKTVSSAQEVASSIDELQDSYDTLYGEGWLRDHRNLGEAKQMLDKLDVGPGLLLDVACGLGYMLDMAEDRGATAYGIDISKVALLRSLEARPGRHIAQANGEHLPYPDGIFDYVTCLGSLEHFIDPDLGAQEIFRVLRPSGHAVILLPNSHHLMAIYNVYKTGGILPEMQDFERFGTRVEWQSFLERNGLRVLSVHKYNHGFARVFRKGREGFYIVFNTLYHLLGDWWIPLNLSFSLIFICERVDAPVMEQSKP